MTERYIHIKENLYFDTKDRVIVKNMGNRFVFVSHDRRRTNLKVDQEKRKDAIILKDLIPISKGLLFDKKSKCVYKKVGNNLVLFSKDRRKTIKPIKVDRRKKT